MWLIAFRISYQTSNGSSVRIAISMTCLLNSIRGYGRFRLVKCLMPFSPLSPKLASRVDYKRSRQSPMVRFVRLSANGLMIKLKSSRMLSMAMKIAFVGLITAALAVSAPVGSVVAQTQEQLDRCEGKNDPPVDLMISECTEVMQSGNLTGNYLAIIFNNRSNAYRMKREFDRAIADYDQAIQRAPNLPGPFLGRAQTKSKKGDRAGFDADIARLKQLCGGPSLPLCFPPGVWTGTTR